MMSFDKNDVKHGIDNVAAHLKDAVDKIAEATSESREKVSEKARELARNTALSPATQLQKRQHVDSGRSNL
jgi:hypothetical protein